MKSIYIKDSMKYNNIYPIKKLRKHIDYEKLI